MKNKIPCDIVQDILPLYIDKLTSEVTNEQIKEHTSECEMCRERLKNMQCEIQIEEDTVKVKEINYLKKTRRSFKKKILISVMSVFCVFLLIFSGFMYMVFGTKTRNSDDITYYFSLYEASQKGEIFPETLYSDSPVVCSFDLPDRDYLGTCSDYRFNLTQKVEFIFMSTSYVLVCQFSDVEYSTEKEKLDEKYSWTQRNFSGEFFGIKPYFELDGFSFRAVEDSDVKEMFLVGTSDDTNEIAYVFFYDPDIDYIEGSFTDFVTTETGWKKVVK